MLMCHLRLAALGAALLCLAGPAVAQDQDAIPGIVADQVRSQGFACDNPVSAEKIEAESQPDLPVYILTCEGVRYHVQLIPDQGAKISVVE
jgi:hypothetical protein